jgi:lipid-binding SYLF domain-containing protein
MTIRILAVMLAVALLLTTAPSAQEASSDEARRVRDATSVFSEVMAAPDSSIPEKILGESEGIAIFPSLVKGGFIVGGMRGRGVLSVRTADGWSPPAFFTLTGGSIGLQIGGQAVDLILVIYDRRGLEQLVQNQFKLGADASVAAGPVGRDAQAATDLRLRAQILSYSRTRGLFAGVTINGSTVRADRDANERFYGKRLESKQILFDGAAGTPGPVPAWLETLKKYAP